VSVGSSQSSADGRIAPRDLAVVAGQLGRSPRGLTGIAVRCPFGYPAVIETAPVLAGAPNPTLLYLSCPVMVATVSRAEAAGAVRAFREWTGTDPEAGQALEQITRQYRERRTSLARERSPEARLDAGIGGPSGPEKASCLHAYAAALLAVMAGWPDDGSSERSALPYPAAAAHPTVAVDPAAVPGPEVVAKELAGGPGATGAARPASDAEWTPLARRIWERFLPPIEETWCRDGSCARWSAR
jgi:hypothetical protein